VNHLQANQQSTWWPGYGECSMLRWCSGREEHAMSSSSSMTLDNPVDVLRHHGPHTRQPGIEDPSSPIPMCFLIGERLHQNFTYRVGWIGSQQVVLMMSF
jgi:hypothetical protein